MDRFKKLAERLHDKDENALEEVMNLFTPLVTTIIANIGRGTLSKEDIEEAAMDTYVTLWQNSEKIQENSLKGYLCTIAKSKALNKLKTIKKGVITDISEIDIEDEFSLEGNIETKEQNRQICRIIEEIEIPDKEIVLRFYFYYQKISEIAEIMNMSEGTVKTKLRRARKIIKEKLIERGYAV
ncbi:MAG: sigma-70 family RNA polymerase sigma factor [Clostridia bacterium]|nr:sigma-70 family RNA polymerase sigma factor [Clostridia bacterium]